MTERRRRWVLAIVCISATMTALDNLILNLAVPALARDVDASTSELQWIIDAYMLVFAGMLLVGGSLGDRYGRARMLRVGLGVFGAASLVAAFANDVPTLVVCRSVMGVGAALLLPNSVAILANVFTHPRERARAFAMFSVAGGLGVALGPVLGGLLLSSFSWSSIFVVNVPIVVLALAVGWVAIPESRDPRAPRFDPLGVVLAVLSVTGLVFATIEAPTNGWGSLETIVSFVVATALLGCFIAWELHCPHPMLQLSFFRDRRFSVAQVNSSSTNLAFAGTMFMLTQFLQSVIDYSPLEAGLRLLPLATGFVAGGWASTRVADRIGTKTTVAAGLVVSAAGTIAFTAITQHSPYTLVAVAMFLLSLGQGIALAPLTDAVVGSVPIHKAGVASGMLSTVRQTGSALGVALIGSVLVSSYRSELAARTRSLALQAGDRAETRSSLDAAVQVARRLGGSTGQALERTADAAFVHGMHIGAAVTACLLLLSAALAVRHLPAHASHVVGAIEH